MSSENIFAQIGLNLLGAVGEVNRSNARIGQQASINPADNYEYTISQVASASGPPKIQNGTLTIFGNELSLISATNLESDQSIKEIQLTVVGTKKTTGSYCCFLITFILGCLLLIPLFFMSCVWWKKIVYPMYEISEDFYRQLADLLQKYNQCRMFTLNVFDNAFNAEKARLVRLALEGSALKGFVFRKLVISCDYKQTQASDFINNVSSIKQLPIPCLTSWDGVVG